MKTEVKKLYQKLKKEGLRKFYTRKQLKCIAELLLTENIDVMFLKTNSSHSVTG